MKKYISFVCAAILTACIISLNLYDDCMIAYAAGDSKKPDISKGACVAIMIFIFIISGVVAGLITFKNVKKKNSDISAEKLSSDEKK